MAAESVIHPARLSHARKALTPEEILTVLNVASESKRNLAMILLAYRHGMRASEVCELRLSDLDLKNGQVTIRRLKGSLTTTQPVWSKNSNGLRWHNLRFPRFSSNRFV